MRNFGITLPNVHGINEGFDIVLESVAILFVPSYVHTLLFTVSMKDISLSLRSMKFSFFSSEYEYV
jgi:hypothetical protein